MKSESILSSNLLNENKCIDAECEVKNQNVDSKSYEKKTSNMDEGNKISIDNCTNNYSASLNLSKTVSERTLQTVRISRNSIATSNVNQTDNLLNSNLNMISIANLTPFQSIQVEEGTSNLNIVQNSQQNLTLDKILIEDEYDVNQDKTPEISRVGNSNNISTNSIIYNINNEKKLDAANKSIFYTPSTICNYYQHSNEVTPNKNCKRNFKINLKDLTMQPGSCKKENTSNEDNSSDNNENVVSSSRNNLMHMFERKTPPIKYTRSQLKSGEKDRKQDSSINNSQVNTSSPFVNIFKMNSKFIDESIGTLNKEIKKTFNISDLEIQNKILDEENRNLKEIPRDAGRKNLTKTFDQISNTVQDLHSEISSGNFFNNNFLNSNSKDPKASKELSSNMIIKLPSKNENFSFDITRNIRKTPKDSSDFTSNYQCSTFNSNKSENEKGSRKTNEVLKQINESSIKTKLPTQPFNLSGKGTMNLRPNSTRMVCQRKSSLTSNDKSRNSNSLKKTMANINLLQKFKKLEIKTSPVGKTPEVKQTMRSNRTTLPSSEKSMKHTDCESIRTTEFRNPSGKKISTVEDNKLKVMINKISNHKTNIPYSNSIGNIKRNGSLNRTNADSSYKTYHRSLDKKNQNENPKTLSNVTGSINSHRNKTNQTFISIKPKTNSGTRNNSNSSATVKPKQNSFKMIKQMLNRPTRPTLIINQKESTRSDTNIPIIDKDISGILSKSKLHHINVNNDYELNRCNTILSTLGSFVEPSHNSSAISKPKNKMKKISNFENYKKTSPPSKREGKSEQITKDKPKHQITKEIKEEVALSSDKAALFLEVKKRVEFNKLSNLIGDQDSILEE